MSEQLNLNAQRMRALAHPLRVRIIYELVLAGRARTSDIAETIGEAANKTSYHLRTLEENGLVRKTEAPEGSTDARETWWTMDTSFTYDPAEMLLEPALGEMHRLTAQNTAELQMRSHRINADKAWHQAGAIFPIRLTREEADYFWAKIVALHDEMSALVESRHDQSFDADVTYWMDASFFPVVIHHPEKGKPPTT